MPIPDDTDPDTLISRLSGPLLPADRAAFRRAAEDALARVPCWGEGAVYRAVATLQRQFWTPPVDPPSRREPRHLRSDKRANLPPIGEDSARGRSSAKTRWLRNWRT